MDGCYVLSLSLLKKHYLVTMGVTSQACKTLHVKVHALPMQRVWCCVAAVSLPVGDEVRTENIFRRVGARVERYGGRQAARAHRHPATAPSAG